MHLTPTFQETDATTTFWDQVCKCIKLCQEIHDIVAAIKEDVSELLDADDPDYTEEDVTSGEEE